MVHCPRVAVSDDTCVAFNTAWASSCCEQSGFQFERKKPGGLHRDKEAFPASGPSEDPGYPSTFRQAAACPQLPAKTWLEGSLLSPPLESPKDTEDVFSISIEVTEWAAVCLLSAETLPLSFVSRSSPPHPRLLGD